MHVKSKNLSVFVQKFTKKYSQRAFESIKDTKLRKKKVF